MTTAENGREPCPECGDRDTEKQYGSRSRDRFECHRCGHEWRVEKDTDRPGWPSLSTAYRYEQ